MKLYGDAIIEFNYKRYMLVCHKCNSVTYVEENEKP